MATVEECVAPAEVPPRAGGRGRGRGVVPPVLWEPEMVAPLSIDCSEYIGSQNRRIPRRRRSGYPLAGKFMRLYLTLIILFCDLNFEMQNQLVRLVFHICWPR